MSTLAIFKCRLVNINYIFRDAGIAVFKQRTNEKVGQYLTDDPDRIKELTEVVSKGHPHIYIDAAECEVDSALADPAVAYRKQVEDDVRAKLIAEMQANGGKLPDMGSTEAKAPDMGIANSTSIAGGAVDSNGAPQGGIKVNVGGGK